MKVNNKIPEEMYTNIFLRQTTKTLYQSSLIEREGYCPLESL